MSVIPSAIDPINDRQHPILPHLPLWASALVLGLAYFGLALVGDLLTFHPSGFSTYWPPSGLYVAALLLSKRRSWPFLILGAVAGNIAFDLVHGRALIVTVLYSTGNSLEAVVGAWLVHRLTGERFTLSVLKHTLALIFGSAIFSTLISASLGAAVVTMTFGGQYWTTWRMWWIGDALGVLTIAPFILVWVEMHAHLKPQGMSLYAVEITLTLIGLLAVAWVVFSIPSETIVSPQYLVLPFLVLIALRFQLMSVVTANATLSLAALGGVVHQASSVTAMKAPPDQQVFALEAYLVTIVVTVLILAVVLLERKRGEVTLRLDSEIMANMVEGVALIRASDGMVVHANSKFETMFGYRPGDLIGKNISIVNAPTDQSPEQIAQEIQRVLEETGLWSGEIHNRKKDGTLCWSQANISIFEHPHHGKVWIAIQTDITDRKGAEDATVQRASELQALYDTALEINTQRDLHTLLQAIVERSARLLNAHMGGLYLMQADNETLELVIVHNLPSDFIGTRLKLGEGVSGRVAQTREVLMIPDHRTWAGRAGVYAASPFRRVLGVPLMVGGRVIGVINVTDDQQTGAFDEDAVRLVKLFADQAAIAIENARLLDAERTQRSFAEALRDIAATLNGTLDLDEVLKRILLNVERVLPHDSANIMLIDNGEAHVVAGQGRVARSSNPFDTGARFIVKDVPTMHYMVETGRPLALPDTHSAPDWVVTPDSAWIHSHAGSPMRVKGRTIGFLNLDSATPGFYTQVQAERLQAFADQAALAIENAQLFDAARQYADELERRVAMRTTELEHERNQMRTILDSAGEGILLMTSDRSILYVNPALEQLTGYTLREAVGKTPPQLWRSDLTPAAVTDELDRCIARGLGWRGEVINRRKDGTLYDAAVTVAPISDAAQMTTGFVVVQRDISHLKELARLQDQFVSRIGHELRTPLTNLIVYLDLLEHGKPDKHDRYMHTLQAEAERLHRLVDGFLEISALDAGTASIKIGPTELNRLMDDIVADWRAQADEKAITLAARPYPEELLVQTDTARLYEVLTRLLDNALGYAPRDGQITITADRNVDSGTSWCTLTVSNTGSGLSPEDLRHLFERFYRGSATRDYKVSGIGLGLAICHAIMEQLGGRITADNLPDRGVAFTIWLRA